ncbi:MAG TPA: hypothetical protein ENK65_03320 [Helicobacteraceae bacterium]|nr:hypothetical protein [Helicobacteraceae bacterium]
MCLILTFAFLVSSVAFYMHGLMTNSIISLSIALVSISFFTYRMVKNRACIFGNKKDCDV